MWGYGIVDTLKIQNWTTYNLSAHLKDWSIKWVNTIGSCEILSRHYYLKQCCLWTRSQQHKCWFISNENGCFYRIKCTFIQCQPCIYIYIYTFIQCQPCIYIYICVCVCVWGGGGGGLSMFDTGLMDVQHLMLLCNDSAPPLKMSTS